MRPGPKPRSVPERFEEKVSRSDDGCWLWRGVVAVNGYGTIGVNGKTVYAHRLSYEINIGEIPTGKYVLHRCDVRNCVNPAHLFLGTHKENMVDMKNKGRSTHGARNPMAKLREADIINIRAIYSFIPQATLKNLADIYHVSKSTISMVVGKKRWSAVV